MEDMSDNAADGFCTYYDLFVPKLQIIPHLIHGWKYIKCCM